MQDLPPETLAKIAAAAPAALLALSTVVAPLIGSILPQDLKRAWSEPSDGSTAPPGAKDYSDDAYRSKDSSTRVAVRTWKSWTLSTLAGAEAVVWTVAAFIVLVRAYPWMNVIEAASIAASWVSLVHAWLACRSSRDLNHYRSYLWLSRLLCDLQPRLRRCYSCFTCFKSSC